MLMFNIIWGGNMSFQLHVRRDDVSFCEEFLKIMATDDMCELLQYNSCSVSGDREQRVWEFLCKRLERFCFPRPEKISIRQVK